MTCILHRFAFSFLALLFLSISQANDINLPTQLSGEPGSFISIPVSVEAGDRLEVKIPAGLQLVGQSPFENGKSLINVLVYKTAPAGVVQLGLTVIKEETNSGVKIGKVIATHKIPISILPEAGLSLRAPEGSTIIKGEEASYVILLSNTGNAKDTLRLSASGSSAVTISPDILVLEPKETAEVLVSFTPESLGEISTILWAKSGADENLQETAVITTNVLAFAGADTVDGPQLRYGLETTVNYDGEALGYSGTASLEGDLSEKVQTRSSLSIQNNQLSGSIALSGDDWGVTYTGSSESHELSANASLFGVQASASLALDGSHEVSLNYDENELRLTFNHKFSSAGNREDNSSSEEDANTLSFRDYFSASYFYRLNPNLSFTPSLSLQGTGKAYSPGAYSIDSLLALAAQYDNDLLLAAATLTLDIPLSERSNALNNSSLNVTVSSRVQDPVGVNADASLSADSLGLGVSAQENLSEELSLNQRVSFQSDYAFEKTQYGLRFGASYRPQLLPLSLTASLQTALITNQLKSGYTLGANYSLNQFSAQADLNQQASTGNLNYGVRFAYRQTGLSVDLAYRHTETSISNDENETKTANDELSFGISSEWNKFSTNLTGNYDFLSNIYSLSADGSYNYNPNLSLNGGLNWTAESLRFTLNATMRLTGGLATPESVIDIFGGRVEGLIEGIVFQDANENGVFDDADSLLAGSTVSAAGQKAKVSPDGHYKLRLTPGIYTLQLSDLPANLGLKENPTIEVIANETTQLNLATEVVISFTGLVHDDLNRNGQLDEEARIPYASIQLSSPTGETLETRTDAQGKFFFQNLKPGSYTVTLQSKHLPEFYEVISKPIQLDLNPGPLQRITLIAAEKIKIIEQSISQESLTMFVKTGPSSVAPGADVKVTVEAQGHPESIFIELAGTEVQLDSTDGKLFTGRISIPQESKGIANLSVTATRGNETINQRSIIMLNANAALANLELSSAILDPEESFRITTEVFKQVQSVYLILNGERYPMLAQDAYTFTQDLIAPATPDIYELELWADDERLASSNFRVSEVSSKTGN